MVPVSIANNEGQHVSMHDHRTERINIEGNWNWFYYYMHEFEAKYFVSAVDFSVFVYE